jgi:hypothetical protein
MFASQMIGPVAQIAHQDRRREHAAERRVAQARASARQADAGDGGGSRAEAMAAWLACIYLSPISPVSHAHPRGQIHQERSKTVDRVSWASAATWLSRVVSWLSDRHARTVAP